MGKRNKTRPYSEDLIFNIHAAQQKFLEELKKIEVTLNLVYLTTQDLKTQLDLLGNKQFLDEQVQQQVQKN